MRNRLVHEYEAIDDTIVIAVVRQAQDLYPQYIAAVERHLASSEP
ncbi:HepT-like ribonuclease domain-containing protein [Nitrospira sp. Nam80]